MIHLYFGDGKGKTSAAAGMAIRAAGNGRKVAFVQFMKGGFSGEIEILRNIENIAVFRSRRDLGFFRDMSDEERAEAAQICLELLEKGRQAAANGGFLILDEITHAVNYGLAPEERVKEILLAKDMEIVLTGRKPKEFMIESADYVSEIKKIKHPYDAGAAARKGVEF